MTEVCVRHNESKWHVLVNGVSICKAVDTSTLTAGEGGKVPCKDCTGRMLGTYLRAIRWSAYGTKGDSDTGEVVELLECLRRRARYLRREALKI
jgi:hypothetical protein